MQASLLLAIAAAGSVGSVCRYLLGQLVLAWCGEFPLHTFVVNALGCLLFGVVYAVGSGRIDLCLRWPHPAGLQRFAFELKVRRTATDPRAKGLDQLTGYLERLDLADGTLMIFDLRQDAPPIPGRIQREKVAHRGRNIEVVTL